MPGSIKHDGIWKEADWFTRISGSWTPVQSGYIKQSGVWLPFYTAEVAVIAPTLLTSQNIATIFDNHEVGLWASSKKKRLIVDSNIGPLLLNSAFGGSLVIEVQDGASVSGFGGSAGISGAGEAGGSALLILNGSDIEIVNNGIIRGGGGGGGQGGQGGAGQYSGTLREPPTSDFYSTTAPVYRVSISAASPSIHTWIWNGTTVYSAVGGISVGSSLYKSPYRYYAGSLRTGSNGQNNSTYGIYRTSTQNFPTTGGAGGAGGKGQGVDGDATNGSDGTAGGTDAGTGGTGGNGGAYGEAGATGNVGSNGTVSNGDEGSSGGPAGKSINGYNRVNYSGSGSLVGPTADT